MSYSRAKTAPLGSAGSNGNVGNGSAAARNAHKRELLILQMAIAEAAYIFINRESRLEGS